MTPRVLTVPLLLAGSSLIVFPLADTLIGLWPFRLDLTSWRLGALGMLSRSVMVPTLGLTLILAALLLVNRTVPLRLFAMATVVAALGILGSIGLFVLDAVQIHAAVAQEAGPAFRIATIVALSKYLFGFVALLSLTVAASRAGHLRGKSQPHSEDRFLLADLGGPLPRVDLPGRVADASGDALSGISA